MEFILNNKTVCKILNISSSTLAKWSRLGKIKFTTTSGGHRRYNSNEIEKIKPILAFGGRVFTHTPKLNIMEVIETEKKYCKCGCGQESPKSLRNWHNRGIKKGQYFDYICGHHMKNKKVLLKTKLKSSKTRLSRKSDISPYLPNCIARYNDRDKRWYCTNPKNKKSTIPHARAVYEYFFGIIPNGFTIHHKNKNHNCLTDDKPENLIAIPKIWNLHYLPYLARGFELHESIVTNCYIKALEYSNNKNLFQEVCKLLIEKKESF